LTRRATLDRPLKIAARYDMQAWPLTAFDYLVLVILVASVVVSVLRGLVREILSLFAWLAAFFVAVHWAVDAAAILPVAITNPTVRFVIGFGLLLLGTLLVGGLVNMAICRLIAAAGLQLADRGLGGLFGLARGALIVMVLVILGGLTALPQQPFWRNALLAPLAETAVRTMKPMLPPQWAQHVNF
jgi:membrane protein required for colicin V production